MAEQPPYTSSLCYFNTHHIAHCTFTFALLPCPAFRILPSTLYIYKMTLCSVYNIPALALYYSYNDTLKDYGTY